MCQIFLNIFSSVTLTQSVKYSKIFDKRIITSHTDDVTLTKEKIKINDPKKTKNINSRSIARAFIIIIISIIIITYYTILLTLYCFCLRVSENRSNICDGAFLRNEKAFLTM